MKTKNFLLTVFSLLMLLSITSCEEDKVLEDHSTVDTYYCRIETNLDVVPSKLDFTNNSNATITMKENMCLSFYVENVYTDSGVNLYARKTNTRLINFEPFYYSFNNITYMFKVSKDKVTLEGNVSSDGVIIANIFGYKAYNLNK